MTTTELPTIRQGDKVRVVLEGEATYARTGFLVIDNHHTLVQNHRSVMELHVTPKPVPLKVGDIVGDDSDTVGAKAYASLPLGTVLDGRSDQLVVVKGGVIDLNSPGQVHLHANRSFFLPRVIQYLPGS